MVTVMGTRDHRTKAITASTATTGSNGGAGATIPAALVACRTTVSTTVPTARGAGAVGWAARAVAAPEGRAG